MTTKELLEIIILVISGGGGAAMGGFAFATNKYLIEIKDLQRQIREDTYEANQKVLDTLTQSAETIRKLVQNNDNLLNQFGVLKCEVRDIRAVLAKEGLIHDRAGFPEENIPNRTDWGIIEDA